MASTFETSQAIDETVQRMVGDDSITEFRPLRGHGLRFLGILKTTTKGTGESAEEVAGPKPIEIKKLSPLYQSCIDADYLVIFDTYFWQNADQRTKDARLHRALMTIEMSDTGKTKSRSPDVVEFQATLQRYGAYDDTLVTLADVLRDAAQRSAQTIIRGFQTARMPVRDRRAPVAVPADSEDEFQAALHEEIGGEE